MPKERSCVSEDIPFKVVFMGGVPRSGTTFLQIAMAGSAPIATSRETHLFDAYLGHLFNRFRDEEAVFRSADGIRHLIDAQTLNKHLRDIAVSILTAIHAKRPEAAVVLEKTPGHLEYMPMIDACLPEARFVHLVRDPRGVAASLKAASGEAWGYWADKEVSGAAERWLRTMKAVREYSPQLGDRFRQVRYEDLFVRGGEILNDLYRWLGLPANTELRSDLRENYPIGNMVRADAELTDPQHESRAQFFRKGDPESWRKELSAVEIIEIERLCHDEMLSFGYQPLK
jgi:hypothetical protein